MYMLMLYAFLLLAGFLIMTGVRYGVPDMVSDTYYLLGRRGACFPVVMLMVAASAMIALLDSEWGVDCLAFLGCGGLAFVAVAPNYADKDAYPVHKGGAIVAAIGCVGWCLSACWWPTIIIGGAYLVYLASVQVRKIGEDIWYLHSLAGKAHPWYWAEVSAFADVFATYFTCFVKNIS